MPPTGGTRTSLAQITAQARVSYGVSPWSVFSPGEPLVPPDQRPVRVVDFPVSINTSITPRSNEPFGFPALRSFANVEPVRLAIETRKDQIGALGWQIKPMDAKRPRAGAQDRIAAAMKFWRKPDGVTHFATWLRMLLEDLFVLDAPTLERRRNRGGALIGLDVVYGDSIKVLVDATGRRPLSPTPAYEQVVKGLPWALLTTEDLIYAPRNPRPNHLYGLGPVEQIIVTINTVLRRQTAQLAYFTEGNLPAGIINAPEGWTSEQLKTYQQWFDSILTGNQAERSKLIWVAAQAKYQAFKDSPLKDDFDEWLYRVVCYAFSLAPTAFVKAQNKATPETDQERGKEEGIAPLKLWWKQIADDVIQEDLGFEDLEWAWNSDIDVDPDVQSQIDDRDVRNGTATADEIRDRRGMDAYPNGLGARPMVFTGTGPVLLEKVIQDFENPPEPVVEAGVDPNEPVPAKTAPKDAAGLEAAKLAKRAAAKSKLITADRPLTRRAIASMAAGLEPILRKAGEDVSAQVARVLRGLHKAADDAGGEFTPASIAAQIDLAALAAISGVAYDELAAVAEDSATLALAGIGAPTSDALFNVVHDRAVAWARARSAEMVAVDGDKSIVDATRDMIRGVIANGLDNNIGSDAIAKAIQDSTAFSARRAQTIADSEIRMANAAGKREGWDQAADLGLTLAKSWQTAGENVCDICVENEAAGAIPMDDAFPSGAQDEGDSHVGCQCVTYAEVVDQADA